MMLFKNSCECLDLHVDALGGHREHIPLIGGCDFSSSLRKLGRLSGLKSQFFLWVFSSCNWPTNSQPDRRNGQATLSSDIINIYIVAIEHAKYNSDIMLTEIEILGQTIHSNYILNMYMKSYHYNIFNNIFYQKHKSDCNCKMLSNVIFTSSTH